MTPHNFCVGNQNFKLVCTNICGYSKLVGTCTQNLNIVGNQISGYSKLVGPQNNLYSKFAGLRFASTQKNRWFSNLLELILKHLFILIIWGTIICGYSKFVMIQNSR